MPTRSVEAKGGSAGRSAATKKLGSAEIRSQNSATVLRLLWAEREISRADLSRRTGLSRSTISAIVAELLETGLVSEARAGESRGGRKPILLAFNDDAFCMLGIDLGATHVAVAVTNLRGEIRAWRTKPCAVRNDPDGAIALVQALVDEQLSELDVGLSDVLGLGVAVPSPIDPTRPGQLLPLILPKWEHRDLVEELGAAYQLPVFVDNDANLGALAEVWWGGHSATVDLAFIKIGLGVGAGLIINGRIHRGRFGTAGEIGHIALDPAGPRCVCGLAGCINMLIGSKHLLQRVKQQLGDYPDSTLHSLRRLTLDRVIRAAKEEDALALEVLTYAGRTLGVGVANLLNLVAPEVVVLGGSLAAAGDKLIEPLEATVTGMSLARKERRVRIELSQLGERGVALGAATLALEAALDEPQMFINRRLASA